MKESNSRLSSNRPYLLRAIYEWLLDNNLTPQILVDALLPGVQVPKQHIKEGKILLNLSPSAVKNLQMENDRVSFNARFSGTPMQVLVPSAAVLAIFARENGQGMAFPDEELIETQPIEEVASAQSNIKDAPDNMPTKKKPSLKIVK